MRFTADPSSPIEPTTAAWDGTRVLYLSHPSDPIVWWSPDLVLGRPDWLTEPRGADVLDDMVWIPFVTCWQVTADMVEPVPVPSGHGRSYTSQYVEAQLHQSVRGRLGRGGSATAWTTEKSAALREIIGSVD